MHILCVFSGIISKTDASIIQSLRLSCQGSLLARVGWLTPGGKSQHSSAASAVITASRDSPLTAHGLAPHQAPSLPDASSPRRRSDGSSVSGPPPHHSRRESYFDSFSEPEITNTTAPRPTDSSPDGTSTSRRSRPPAGRPWVPGKGAELPSWLHILIRKRE